MKKPPTEAEINERHGERLAEFFGPNYRDNPAYPEVLRQLIEGTRTIGNILADHIREAEPKKRTAGSGW